MRELEVDEGTVGVVGELRLVKLAVEAFLARCLCIWRLFARAFSWVRTKLAKLCGALVSASDGISRSHVQIPP